MSGRRLAGLFVSDLFFTGCGGANRGDRGATPDSGAGITSVPTYWLLDPKCKLIAKNYDTEELSKALAEHVK